MYADDCLINFTDAILHCDTINKILININGDTKVEPDKIEAVFSILFTEVATLSGNNSSSMTTLDALFSVFIDTLTDTESDFDNFNHLPITDMNSQMIINKDEHSLFSLREICECLALLQDNFKLVQNRKGCSFCFNKDDFTVTDLSEFAISSIITNHCIPYQDNMRMILSLHVFNFLQKVIEESLMYQLRLLHERYQEHEYEQIDIHKDESIETIYFTIINIIAYIRFTCKTVFTFMAMMEQHTDTCIYALKEHGKSRFI